MTLDYEESRVPGPRTGVEIVGRFFRQHYARVLAARQLPNLWVDAPSEGTVFVKAEPAARGEPRKLRAG